MEDSLHCVTLSRGPEATRRHGRCFRSERFIIPCICTVSRANRDTFRRLPNALLHPDRLILIAAKLTLKIIQRIAGLLTLPFLHINPFMRNLHCKLTQVIQILIL